MSSISELQAEKNFCVTRISSRNATIKNCERGYESLREFKRCVVQSQAGFHAVNSEKEKFLSLLNELSATCRSAEKYKNGMSDTLSGIGVKVVAVAYDALILSINIKMAAYMALINESENEICALERRVAQLDQEIEAARQAEVMSVM